MTEEGTKKVVYIIVAVAVLVLVILLIYKLPVLDEAFRSFFNLEGPTTTIENKSQILYTFYEDYKTCKLSPTDNCICDINLQPIPNYVIKLTNNGIGKTEFVMVEGFVDKKGGFLGKDSVTPETPVVSEVQKGFRTGSKTTDSEGKETFTHPFVSNDNLYVSNNFGTDKAFVQDSMEAVSEVYLTKYENKNMAYISRNTNNRQEISPPFFLYKSGNKMEFFGYTDSNYLSKIKKCEMPTKLRPPLLEFDRLTSMIKNCIPSLNIPDMLSQEIRVFLPELSSDQISQEMLFMVNPNALGQEADSIGVSCILNSDNKNSWSINIYDYNLNKGDLLGLQKDSYCLVDRKSLNFEDQEFKTKYITPLYSNLEGKSCLEGKNYLEANYKPIVGDVLYSEAFYSYGKEVPCRGLAYSDGKIDYNTIIDLQSQIIQETVKEIPVTDKLIVGLYYSIESGKGSWNHFSKLYKFINRDKVNLYQDSIPLSPDLYQSLELSSKQRVELTFLEEKLNAMSFTDALAYLKTIAIVERDTYPPLVIGNPYLPFDIIQQKINEATKTTIEKPNYCGEYKPVSYPDYSIKYSDNTFKLFEGDQLKKAEIISINLCEQIRLEDKEKLPPFEEQLEYMKSFTVEDQASIQVIGYPNNFVCLYIQTPDQLKEKDLQHREQVVENIAKNTVL